jgi:LCP family protein required for cell wall assembly
MAVIAFTVLSVIVVAVGYAVYGYLAVGAKLSPGTEDLKRIEAVLDSPPEQSVETTAAVFTYILLLGEDRHGSAARARSDTIILARLSEADHSVALLSIPRDTRTRVPGYGLTKINHAAAYGGAPLAIETVKAFTGLPVNHYVLIDFDGFKTIVDLLGGVDMYLDRPVNYGQGVVVGTGMQHLDGSRALAVVRNRKAYPEGDFARARNQRALLSAIARKASAVENLAVLPRILMDSADRIETDLSIGEITSLLRRYRDALQGDLPGCTVPGTSETIAGVSYVVADESAARTLFDAIRRGEPPPE